MVPEHGVGKKDQNKMHTAMVSYISYTKEEKKKLQRSRPLFDKTLLSSACTDARNCSGLLSHTLTVKFT